MVAQHMQCAGQVVPVYPPAAGEAAVGTEGDEGVHRFARTIERHRVLRNQVERLGRGRDTHHRARSPERLSSITPADRQHPREVEPVERCEPLGVPLGNVGEGIRRREPSEIHVCIRGEDEGEPKRRIHGRRPLEVRDRTTHVELDEPVQAADELLVRLEVGRLTGARRPTVEPGVEQGRERGHHALAQDFDRAERLSQGPGDGVERPQDLAVLRRGDLDLEADAVALAVVRAPDHGAGAGLAAERPNRGGVEVWGDGPVLRGGERGGHHRYGRYDLHQPRLGEALRHPIRRHVPQVVERAVTRVVFDHRHRDPPLVDLGAVGAEQLHSSASAQQRERRRCGEPDPPPAPTGEDPPRRYARPVRRAPECCGELRGGGEPIVGERRQRFGDRVPDRSHDPALRLTQHVRRFQGRPVADAPLSEARQRRLPCERFEQHAPETVDVGAGVQLDAQRLLGTHIAGGADGLPRLRERRRTRGADRSRDPEIGDDRMAARQQNVLGLDVAVDHPLRMREGERVRDVAGEAATTRPPHTA